MKFKKYPSIENSYREKQIDQIRMHGFASDTEYCVTEKIHGANFGVYADAEEVRFASRNTLLGEDNAKQFYKFDLIRKKVMNDANALFRHTSLNGEVESIIVYGELFGGSYPHPDVPKTKGVSMVQKGVHYSPNLHFSVFDIWVIDKQGDGYFLNYDEVAIMCILNNVVYCEVLYRGTFDECLKYPNDQDSGIPDKYNLPIIDDNTSEGVVIKPIESLRYNNGERVILKNKNLKFSEKNSEKRVIRGIETLSNEMQTTLARLDSYICEERFNSVDSKLGGLEKRVIGNYIKEFVHDVFTDANKDGIIPHHLEKSEQKILNKFVSDHCKQIILPKV